MPVTNVRTRWEDGDLVFYDEATGDAILSILQSTGVVKLGSGIKLDGVSIDLSQTELGLIDSVTAGAIVASKAVARDAASRIPFIGASVNAAGNATGNATLLTADENVVALADGTTGVRLMAGVAGMRIRIINSVTTVTAILKVYPDTGGTINGGGADAAVNIGPGTDATFLCTSASTWVVDKTAAILNYAEIALLTGATAGSITASKAVTRDAGSRIPRVTAVEAAVGNATGNATLLTAEVNAVTGADGAVGVRLMTGVAGMKITIINTAAAILKVYPNTGGQINAGGVDTALSVAANAIVDLVCTAANVWYAATATAGVTSGVAGVAAGYKIARSAAAVAVTGTSDIDTGLASVLGWAITAEDDLDGDAFMGVSAAAGAAGHIVLKCWKSNGDGDATMIAASAAKNVRWLAVGT